MCECQSVSTRTSAGTARLESSSFFQTTHPGVWSSRAPWDESSLCRWSATCNVGFASDNSDLGGRVRQVKSTPTQVYWWRQHREPRLVQSPRRREYPLEWLRHLYTDSGHACRNSVSALGSQRESSRQAILLFVQSPKPRVASFRMAAERRRAPSSSSLSSTGSAGPTPPLPTRDGTARHTSSKP